jgi:SH3-like domain-containing protein
LSILSAARRSPVLAFLLLLGTLLPAAAQLAGGTRPLGPSGLPLPRFASLASSEVNVRTGPSTDHPIRWVYTRNGLPVRIVEEFDVWRRIEDPDGETGWAHSSLLSVRRTIMVRGQSIQEMRRSGEPSARVVARVEPGAIGEFLGCERGWCRIDVAGERGWLPETDLWGVMPED